MAHAPTLPSSRPTAFRLRPGWVRLAAAVLFTAVASWFLWYHARQPVLVKGDGWEYAYQAESFRRHGSPDLWPEDVATVNAEGVQLGLPLAPDPPHAYATAPDGKRYGVHFWAYGLSVAPARECLRWLGSNPLRGLRVANAAWFILALGVVMFGSSVPVTERLALVGLSVSGPVLWYVEWSGAELFSWALALIAVSAYRDRRYGWAGAAAGLAATQNPPLVFLAGAAVLAAAWDRRWRVAGMAAAGGSLALLPFAFFQLHFGSPSLIVAGPEYVGVGNLSWSRAWGLFTDLDQGLLPYAPLLLAGAVFGTARLVWTRNARGLFLLAGGVGMATAVQVANNWNSACAGLMRYLVWMIPVLAGVAVEGIGGRVRLTAFAAVAVVAHAVIGCWFAGTDLLHDGYLHTNRPSQWVLDNYPRVYRVEPEVFVERHRHRDGWPHDRADLPIGHVRPDGSVTKLLLDPADVNLVTVRYEVDPAYLDELRRRAAGESGLFYVHPPTGAVRARPPAAPR